MCQLFPSVVTLLHSPLFFHARSTLISLFFHSLFTLLSLSLQFFSPSLRFFFHPNSILFYVHSLNKLFIYLLFVFIYRQHVLTPRSGLVLRPPSRVFSCASDRPFVIDRQVCSIRIKPQVSTTLHYTISLLQRIADTACLPV